MFPLPNKLVLFTVLILVPLTNVACFASKAVCVAELTGLLASLVLSTLFNAKLVFNCVGVTFFVVVALVSTIGRTSAALSMVVMAASSDIFWSGICQNYKTPTADSLTN
jgi:hypothetical protein